MSKLLLYTDKNFGFLSINEKGYAVLKENANSATLFTLKDYFGKQYYEVSSGDWTGYYFGYQDVHNTYPCATKNWNLCRYVYFNDKKVSFNGADGAAGWKISNNTDEKEVRIGSIPNFEYANLEKYEPNSVKFDSIEYWRFIRKHNEVRETKAYIKKLNTYQWSTKTEFSYKYNLSAEIGIPLTDLIKATANSSQNYEFKTTNETGGSISKEEYFEETVKLTGNIMAWAKFKRYTFNQDFIDVAVDMAFVNSGETPGFNNDQLIMINGKDIVVFKDVSQMPK